MVGGTDSAAERDAVLERFAAFPERLAAAARQAGPSPAGEWSPAEVVRHLIAVEHEVFQSRLASLDDADEPHWSWAEPGLEPGFDDAPLTTILDAFAATRAETVGTVRALDPVGWARAGVHATYGRLDVSGLLRLAVDHDTEHLAGLTRDAR